MKKVVLPDVLESSR